MASHRLRPGSAQAGPCQSVAGSDAALACGQSGHGEGTTPPPVGRDARCTLHG
jgi:hypothetical protein